MRTEAPPIGAGRYSRGFVAAGLVLGVALSGFFDGILLHQVLQWHHLLSLVDAPALRDLRAQVLADGLFHGLIYVVMALGLWLLWRGRREFAREGAGRVLAAYVIVGFGLWNVADVVGFHWLAGIHRIRVDVDEPLLWDLGWLMLFGLLPLILGACIRRRPGPGSGGRAAATVAGAVIIAGLVSLRPTPGLATAVVFPAGVSQADSVAAVARQGADILAVDRDGRVLVVQLPPGANSWMLYLEGALLVGGAGPTGCSVFTMDRSRS